MTLHDMHATAYDTAHFDDNFPPGIEDHFWFLARNDVLDRTLRDAERRGHLPPRPVVLEVGCGTGIVVAGLRQRGHDIWGVELGQPPRSALPDRIRTRMRAQDLEPGFRARVDALLFLDVIEHLPDDVDFLRETLAAFPKCRAVFITVPARPELWSNHDRHYGHYRRYTRGMLRRTLRAAGLEAAQTRYVFRSLYAAAALITISGRQRNPVLTAPGIKALHRAMAAMLATEDRALSALPLLGLSILATGRRALS